MSEYIDGYIQACKETIEKYDSPKWFVEFFETYHNQIQKLSGNKSAGNRTFLTTAFGNALPHLIPDISSKSLIVEPETQEHFRREVSLKEFIEIKNGDEFHNFLGRKRIDFVLKNKSGKLLLIEYKNTANFDSISSAAVQMSLIKKFCKKELTSKITTWSVSMFCGQSPDALGMLNEKLDRPIDEVFLGFRKWDSDRGFETPFDPKKFIALRTALIEFAKT
jgi:hypothetical protein